MRFLSCVFLFTAFALPLAAQTYTPKTVRFDGVPESDRTELLQSTGFLPGAPVTKEQIEAALGKLADSNAYTDLSYSVGPEALVIKLTPVAGNEIMPARFGNFVWWDPQALESLVEARVPGFHGELQFRSAMTDNVVRALETIAKEKGIPARVSPQSDPIHHAVVLHIDSPIVLFGDLKLSEEIHPAMGGNTVAIEHDLKNSEFSALETPETIVSDVTRVFNSAGYLDAFVDPPVFSSPHALGGKYIVDGSATIHRGEQYHVSAITFSGAPAGTENGLRKEANVKVGGPASPAAARLSNADLEAEMADHGYLSAKSSELTSKNTSTHTVAYVFEISPGDLYRLSSLDASHASPDLQAAFAKDRRLQPGVILDHTVTDAITEIILKLDPKRSQRLATNLHPDAGKGEASITLLPVKLPPGIALPPR